MSEETKKVTAPQADAEIPAEEVKNAPEEEETPEGDESTPEDNKDDSEDDKGSDDVPVDYKALAAQERERRLKAEKALAQKRYLKKHGKPMPDDYQEKEDDQHLEDDEADEINVDDIDEDKPLTMRELKAIEARRIAKQQIEHDLTRAKDLVKDYTDNPDEAELILETYQSRKFPEFMSVEEKLEESYLIANKGTIFATNKELARTLKNKENVNKAAPSTHRKKQVDTTQPKLTEQDKKIYADSGFVFKPENKRFEKALPNGDILVKIHETKQTFVVKKK